MTRKSVFRSGNNRKLLRGDYASHLGEGKKKISADGVD